jgi:leader peptidase (prepilin peptidase) / N-methyltransferase
MYLIFIFALGLIIGSFLNVCIYRIPKNESISFPPSHCTSCDNKIGSYDLIPVLSYILLKGKCRHCGEKISIKYPIIELLTGVLFVLLYIKFGLSFELVKYSALTGWLIVIGIIDFETTDIYFKTTITGIIAAGVFIIVGYFLGYGVSEYILGGLLGSGLISVIVLLTKGMGWGDVEVFLLSGLFIGLKLTAITLFFSFIIGGVAGILLIILKKKSRKDYIPFAPYITIGTMIAVLIGDQILKWYML